MNITNDDEHQLRILMNHQNIAPIYKNTDESSTRDQVLYSVGSMPSYLFIDAKHYLYMHEVYSDGESRLFS